MRVQACLTISLGAATACSVTDVDPAPSGVFPCDTADDCPSGQSCVIGSCFEGDPPTVTIVRPEDEQPFLWESDVATTMVMVSISGSDFDLVDESDSEPEFGQGYVVLFVDDTEAAKITTGNLSAGVSVVVNVNNTPGVHRLRAEARFSDGRTYDNLSATSRRLYWLDDGFPHVGFKSPFPNDAFALPEHETLFTLAVLNFVLLPQFATPTQEASGHAHLLYNKSFPACGDDPTCVGDYTNVLDPEQGPTSNANVTVTLPAAVEGAPTTLSLLLARPDHSHFTDANDSSVWDTIPIQRRDIPVPPPPETDGG
jgi:hypothetical protein